LSQAIVKTISTLKRRYLAILSAFVIVCALVAIYTTKFSGDHTAAQQEPESQSRIQVKTQPSPLSNRSVARENLIDLSTEDRIAKLKELLKAPPSAYHEIEQMGRNLPMGKFSESLELLSDDELPWNPVSKGRFAKGLYGSAILLGWPAIENFKEAEPALMKRLDLDSRAALALASTDPERTLKFAETHLSGSAYRDAVALAIKEVATRDLEKAKGLFDSLQPGSARESVASHLALQMSKDNLDAALEWSFGLPSPEERSAAVTRIGSDWGFRDPEAAADFAQSLPQSPERAVMIRTVASQRARYDGPTAIAWLSETAAGDPRAKSSALQVWANYDPKAALEFASSKFGKDISATINKTELYNTYRIAIQKDPEAAAAALHQVGDTQARATLTRSVVRNWMSYDPRAASGWVHDLDPGQQKDAAIESVVRGTTDPIEKLIWASEIQNDQTRDRWIRLVGKPVVADKELMDRASAELTEAQLRRFVEAVK
ncbi:MAG: hypothetical protein AAF585_14535, partial [Verrucomicrobiota bacterium]